MKYNSIVSKLMNQFDPNKLKVTPNEWGFYNEIDKDIQLVGYATNLTPETIIRAKEMQVDFMLTHHDSWEFVFGLKERCNALLQEFHIAHAFFHAPLDDADFGTSASLAKELGVLRCKKVMPYADVFYGGCIGELDMEEPFEQFSAKLSAIVDEPVRQWKNNDKHIKRVCVVAGGGNMTTEMKIAVDNGCDTYVTGEYVLYSQQYANLMGMNLLVGSHTNTEILGVQALGIRLVSETDLKLRRILESND